MANHTTRDALPANTKLDNRYSLLAVAARGGYGITYKALDEHTGEQVALKEYFPPSFKRGEGTHVIVDDSLVREFPVDKIVAEVLRGKAVSHPAIVPIYRGFPANSTGYIVMPWIDGETLLSLSELGSPPEKQLTKVFLTVLDVALHLRRQRIAHRDLNPANIIIRRDTGEPMVIDFGIARAVGTGTTGLPRTVAYADGFAPSEQLDPHGDQGIWTDTYGLAASIFYAITGVRTDPSCRNQLLMRKQRRDHTVEKYSESFLKCIDGALVDDPESRLYSPDAVLACLGLEEKDLEDYLSADILKMTLLTGSQVRYVPKRKLVDTGHTRPHYQSTLLQSFDTARFQEGSFLHCSDGESLEVAMESKIALARTEAALALMFGREILVPAGQIAESPAFISLFGEVIGPFNKLRKAIFDECQRNCVPPFLPMKVGLQESSFGDYAGFVRQYSFTGAPLQLIKSSGGNVARHEESAHRVESFKALFLAEKYEDLEAAVKIPGYGLFARTARHYFSREAATVADPSVPEPVVGHYESVFRDRLTDRRITGNGVAAARDKLPLVDEVVAKLQETNSAGLRGNWYLFAPRFQETWQLARAYLDTRLFLRLARQYRVDHPVLVTQEFEYGAFDHSLYLGPALPAEATTPGDDRLLELASHFTRPIAWEAIFELFANGEFLRSVQLMNAAFAAGDELKYVDSVRAHGRLLDAELGHLFRFTTEQGHVVVQVDDPQGETQRNHQVFEPATQSNEARANDAAIGNAYYSGYGEPESKHVAVRKLNTTAVPRAKTGSAAGRAVLNYYAKPYRLLASTL